MVEKNFVKEKEKEKEKNRTGGRSTPSGRKEQIIKHDCLLYPSTGVENGLREVATVALEHGGGRRRDQARSWAGKQENESAKYTLLSLRGVLRQ